MMKKHILAAAFALAASNMFAGAIPLRGVVEGYYGRPWGTEGRLSLLKFMAENDMNIFIYGPKDDPYHHSKWREPYPEAAGASPATAMRRTSQSRLRSTYSSSTSRALIPPPTSSLKKS